MKRFIASLQSNHNLKRITLGATAVLVFLLFVAAAGYFYRRHQERVEHRQRTDDQTYFNITRDHDQVDVAWRGEAVPVPTFTCLYSEKLRKTVAFTYRGQAAMESSTAPGRRRKPVNLGYHLKNLSTGERMEQQEPHYSFAPDIAAGQNGDGETRLVTLQIRCPDKTGDYSVDVAVVQEDIGWLDELAKRPSWAQAKLRVVAEGDVPLDFKNHKFFSGPTPLKSNAFAGYSPRQQQALTFAYNTAVNTLALTAAELPAGDHSYLAFDAGQIYPMVWVRDMATIQRALPYLHPRPALLKDFWTDLFITYQDADGSIPDWVAPGDQKPVGKNTVQSDQELWFILGMLEAVELGLRPRSWLLATGSDGTRFRLAALSGALSWLLANRWDSDVGCLWSGHVADWGDVGLTGTDGETSTKIAAGYPKVCGIFLQALLLQTLQKIGKHAPELLAANKEVEALGGPKTLIEQIKAFANMTLWQEDLGFYQIHVHLEDYNHGHEEPEIFALGGNVMAIRSGLASKARSEKILLNALRLQQQYHISTIGAVLLPPYPASTFANPVMDEEYEYQNGGQWDWFGCRAVAELFQLKLKSAKPKLLEIAQKVERNHGFYEWDTGDGLGRGSPHFRAGAASFLELIHQSVSP